MNRKHTADDYRRLVDRIRAARPDIALSSDFIVGFPGETEADFCETLRLVADVGFASAFSFKYSPRPGTPAADVADSGPGRGQGRAARAPARAVGKPAPGVQPRNRRPERRRSPREAGPASGPACRQVALSAGRPDRGRRRQVGDIVPVRIVRAGSNSLFGERAAPHGLTASGTGMNRRPAI